MNRFSKNRAGILLFAAIFLSAGAIRLYRSGESFNGYHGFNEIWYVAIARNYRLHSLFEPYTLLGNVDRNVPPLTSWLLYGWMGVFGDSEFSARCLMIGFNLATLVLVFKAARQAAGMEAGLAAMSFAAFIPMDVITGRNVQTESAYAAFLMASLVLLTADGGNGGLAHRAWAGFLWGLSLFSKQFALFSIPGLIAWGMSRPGPPGKRVAGALAFGVPAALVLAPFFGYQALCHWSEAFGKQAGFLGLFESPDWALVKGVVREMRGAFTLPGLTALIAGGVWGLFRGGQAFRLFALCGFSYLGMFFFLHFHGYYMFPAGPLLAVCAGGAWAAFRVKAPGPVSVGVLASCALFSIFSSLSLLCGAKYGYDDFKNLGVFLKDSGHPDASVITVSRLSSQYFPILQHYAPEATVLREEDLARRSSDGRLALDPSTPTLLLFFPDDPRINEFSGPLKEFFVSQYAPVLLGWRFFQRPPNEHFFQRGPMRVQKTGPWTRFGVAFVEQGPALVMRGVPDARRLFIREGRLMERDD